MKPHAFVPDPQRASCKVCGQSRGHSAHLSHDDTTAETDGAQAYRFIRGVKP